MILRDYQKQAVDSIVETFGKHASTLVVLPTGTGKTIVFSDIIGQYLARGRVMVVAHREELLDQARDKIKAMTGIYPELEMAEFKTVEGGMFDSQIIVSSIQTQVSGRDEKKRMHKFNPDDFSLLVVDEAHHAASNTYRAVIDYYRSNPNLKVLGVTATPDRHDEKALGVVFESVAFDYEIVTAIREGWLCPIKQRYLSVEVDFSGVRTTLGDLNGKDLREVLARGDTLEQIASDTIQYADDRLTLVFSDCIANAERLTEAFNRHRLGSARIVTGMTPRDERRKLIRDYRDQKFQYLLNVGVATEGFDVPEIACVVQARPTCSRSLYAQQAGRGTRPIGGIVDGLGESDSRCAVILASDKPDCLILDIVGNSKKHRLIHAGDILGGEYSDEIVELANRETIDGDMPVDILEQLEKTNQKRNEEIEAQASKKSKLRIVERSRSQDVDPFDLFGVEDRRTKGWENAYAQPTEAQREKLKSWGIETGDMDGIHADQIINEFRSRTRRGLCTYKQARMLVKKWGMTQEEARKTNFVEAGRIITLLARNNWRKPVEAEVV